MSLSPSQAAALVRALHSTEGAATRWAATVRPDDNALTARIAEEFGIHGGFGAKGVWVDYKGGMNPRIEIRIGAETPVELSGRDLLAAVRDAIHRHRPGELF
jgi:hypothetical protein